MSESMDFDTAYELLMAGEVALTQNPVVDTQPSTPLATFAQLASINEQVTTPIRYHFDDNSNNINNNNNNNNNQMKLSPVTTSQLGDYLLNTPVTSQLFSGNQYEIPPLNELGVLPGFGLSPLQQLSPQIITNHMQPLSPGFSDIFKPQFLASELLSNTETIAIESFLDSIVNKNEQQTAKREPGDIVVDHVVPNLVEKHREEVKGRKRKYNDYSGFGDDEKNNNINDNEDNDDDEDTNNNNNNNNSEDNNNVNENADTSDSSNSVSANGFNKKRKSMERVIKMTNFQPAAALAQEKKNTKRKPILDKEQKKKHHLESEQRRRNQIKQSFDRLVEIIGTSQINFSKFESTSDTENGSKKSSKKKKRGTGNADKAKISKSDILNRSIWEIQSLLEINAKLESKCKI